MSYSSDVKNNLAEKAFKNRCCMLTELAALIYSCGSIDLAGKGRFGFSFTTENEAVMKHIIYKLLKRLGISDDTIVVSVREFKYRNVFNICIPASETAVNILLECGVLASRDGRIEIQWGDMLIERGFNECCKRAFLRGVFIGSGSISDIKKAYHTEIVVRDEAFAAALCGLLASQEVNGKLTLRSNQYVVYIKDSESIEIFMTLIGAHNVVLDLENIKILREIKNNTNRAVNCDTANNLRIIRASEKQIKAIRILTAEKGFSALPEGLRETAELRINYPDASLEELCEMHCSSVTKSGVNDRLRKLCAMAENLDKN